MTKRGRRKVTDVEKLYRIEYYEKCEFKINGIIHLIEGNELLNAFGMYHRIKNPGGVVRDHIV